MIIVLSGPGGVGKGTVAQLLAEGDADLHVSRSWTTRERRAGEAANAYHFVTRREFEALRAADGFLEWNEFLGNYYGTPRPASKLRGDLLLEIDVNGGRQVLADSPDAKLIFVDTPSLDDQRARLLGRGDDPKNVEQRMSEGEAERFAAETLGYHWVVNDEVHRCASEISGLIERWRAGEHEGPEE